MKRPLGVTIIAGLILLYGLLGTALGLFVLVLSVLHDTGKLPPEVAFVVGNGSVFDVLMVAAQFTLGVFALVSGIGLLRLRPWAWLMGMLLLGCELAMQLINYFQGRPVYLLMLLTALMVFYLNRRSIREVFSLEPEAPAVPTSIELEPASSVSTVEPQTHSAPR